MPWGFESTNGNLLKRLDVWGEEMRPFRDLNAFKWSSDAIADKIFTEPESLRQRYVAGLCKGTQQLLAVS
jgi:hypothetical protein